MIEEGALLDLFFSSSFSNKEVVIIFDINDRTSPVVSGSTGRPQEDCYFIILFFFTIFFTRSRESFSPVDKFISESARKSFRRPPLGPFYLCHVCARLNFTTNRRHHFLPLPPPPNFYIFFWVSFYEDNFAVFEWGYSVLTDRNNLYPPAPFMTYFLQLWISDYIFKWIYDFNQPQSVIN